MKATPLLSLLLPLGFLTLLACGVPPGPGDDDDASSDDCGKDIPEDPYLMAFNSCPDPGCGPTEHTVHLAGSHDGRDWSLLDLLGSDHAGSVPDIVPWGDSLLLFHTGAGGDHMWDRLDSCFEIQEQGVHTMVGGTVEDEGWVDPSLMVDGDDLLLYYLPGLIGSNPAGCPPGEETCIKEIRSARTNAETFPSFTVVPGPRVEQVVGEPPAALAGFSDPDIVPLQDGSYLLYVSSGENALVYVGDDPDGSFEVPEGGSDPQFVSRQEGGVPSAIQDDASGEIWLYVHRPEDGSGTVIRRAVSGGTSELTAEDFETVLDRNIFIEGELTEGAGVFSPSVIYRP